MLTVCLKNVKDLILTVEEDDVIPVFGKEVGEKLLNEKPIATKRPVGGRAKDDSVSLRNRIRKSLIANVMTIYSVLRAEFEVGEVISVRKVVNTLIYKGFFSPKDDGRSLSVPVNKIIRECCARGLILRGDSKYNKGYKIVEVLPVAAEFFEAPSIVYHLQTGTMEKTVRRSAA